MPDSVLHAHAPRDRRHRAIAAAVYEAADTADRMADRQPGDREVRELHHRLLVRAGQEHDADRRADEPAVENQASLVQTDDLDRVRQVDAQVREDVRDAGAENSGQHDPEPELGAEPGRPVAFFAECVPVGHRREEPQRHEDAVPVDGATADIETNRIHRAALISKRERIEQWPRFNIEDSCLSG
jgi:hypothetical protein